jgi:hypothetical protein
VRRDHRAPQARHDDRHAAAGGLGGQLGDAFQAVAGEDRVDHPQMHAA